MKTSTGKFLLASVLGPQDGAETEEQKRKREAQGMKKGGYVKAADGCAKKGKTKGRMV
jgi:hypothetical protein